MSVKRLSVLAIACAMWLVPARSTGQASRPSKGGDREKRVLKAESDLFRAQEHNDLAAMERLFADDYTHTHTSGQVQSKADFVDGFRKGTRKYAAIDTTDVTVRFYSPTTAVITGHISIAANGAPAGPQPDTFNEVWVLDKGQWRCAASSQIRPPAKK